VAIAHTLLVLTYQVLITGQVDQDKQVPALNQRQKQLMIRHHIRRLGKLGVAVGKLDETVYSPRPGAPATAELPPTGN
jgi:hypothetical protein